MATVRCLVTDVERAIAFYTEQFGFMLEQDPDGNPIELFQARR